MRLVVPTRTELAALFDSSTRSAWICSPWISREGASLLREAMRSAERSLREVELWLRLSTEDARVGLTDYAAVAEWVRELRSGAHPVDVHIWTAANLHAKVVWSERGALVGSANLTMNGYGGNVELSARLERDEAVAQSSIRDVLRARVTRVSEEEWSRFVAACSDSGTTAPTPAPALAAGGWEEFVGALLSEPPPRGIR